MAGKVVADVQYARPIPRRQQQQQHTSNFDLSMQLASSTPEALMKEFLLPHFKRLCREPEPVVRTHLAAVFHEFAQALKHDAPLLIDSFIDISYSGDTEIISHLASHLEETLECIYGKTKGSTSGVAEENKIGNLYPQFHPAHARLIRTLVSFNRLVRNGNQWRCHEQLLTSYSCLNRFLSNEELCQTFIPMIKEEVLGARALPCRLAALSTLIKWTRDLSAHPGARSAIEFCKHNLAHNRSCHKRVLFLDACQMSMELISNQFFKQHFFFSAMQLASDSVLNVRIKLCKLLPLFKSALVLSTDADHATALENALKALGKGDPKGYMAELLNKTTNELACSDSLNKTMTMKNANTPSSKADTAAKPVTKNSSAPLPLRTFPAVLRAMAVIKDGITAQGKNKQAEDSDKKGVASIKVNNADQCDGNPNSILYAAPKPNSTTPLMSAQAQNGFLNNGNAKTSSKLTELLQFQPIPAKKVAVIRPRQIVTRSPSPRPMSQPASLFQYENNFDAPNDTGVVDDAMYPTASGPAFNGNGPAKSPGVDSKFRRFWSKAPFVPAATVDIKNGDGANERIVPIKLVPTTSSPDYDWYARRPPTPATFRRLSVSTASLPRTSAAASAARVRHIPVVRTGLVMKSVEKFENGGF